MMRVARAYQTQALADARAAFRAGKRAILLVAPTGAGKTYLFSRIVEGAIRKGGSALVVAHREELITQAARSIMAEGIEHIGIIAPWARRHDAKVQIASVQTLAAQIKKGRSLPESTLVVLDEAHHFSSGAPGWYEVAGELKRRGTLIIGGTATPERGDGTPMGDIFDCLIPVSSVAELQELGVLVPCVTYRPAHKTKALSREPVQAYEERGKGERCVVFCATVAHADSVAQTFRDRGYPAATIHTDTPWNLRRARLASYQAQDPLPLRRAGSREDAPIVLACVYTLTEGWDCPEASVCIIARGCGHDGMLVQMVGRVGRAAPWCGKDRCIVWDLRGVTYALGLWEKRREYSLDGKAMSAKSDKEDPPRACKECEAVFMNWAIDNATGGRRCPACAAPAPAIEAPEVREREMFAAGSAADDKARRDAIKRLAIECVDKSRQRGWVFYRYREMFLADPDWKDIDAAILAARRVLGVRVDEVEIGAERVRLEEIARARGFPVSWVDKCMAAKFGEAAA